MDDFFVKEITPFAQVMNENEMVPESEIWSDSDLEWFERWKFTDKGKGSPISILNSKNSLK